MECRCFAASMASCQCRSFNGASFPVCTGHVYEASMVVTEGVTVKPNPRSGQSTYRAVHGYFFLPRSRSTASAIGDSSTTVSIIFGTCFLTGAVMEILSGGVS
jgi:hypothetical protein